MADVSVTHHNCIVQCRVCDEAKPKAEFYDRQVRKAGDVGECKDCTRKRVRQRRKDDPSVREYDRERAKLPHRRANARKVTKRWRNESPLGYAAQTAVTNAVRDGRLSKEPCLFCGASKVHGHHRDYSKPLEVVWLCPKCHHRLHAVFPETSAHERKI